MIGGTVHRRHIGAGNFPREGCQVGFPGRAGIEAGKKIFEDRLRLPHEKAVHKGGDGLGVEEAGDPSRQDERVGGFSRPGQGGYPGFPENGRKVGKIVFERDGKGDDVESR